MTTMQSETTETMLTQLAARLDELERENARLQGEVATLTERIAAGGVATLVASGAQPQAPHGRTSRRRMLRSALSAAAATVGAGALLEGQTGTASATGVEGQTTFISTTSTPTVAVKNTGTGHGLSAKSSGTTANAVLGTSTNYTGVAGKTSSTSFSAAGVFGGGTVGVAGSANGATTAPSQPVGVYGTGSNGSNLGGIGVQGDGDTNSGVYGTSSSANGVLGISTNYTGVAGKTSSTSNTAAGVFGGGLIGVAGSTTGATTAPASGTGVGVYGTGSNGSDLGAVGVQGDGDTNTGVLGTSISGSGVSGQSNTGLGIFGVSISNIGIVGQSSTGLGIFGVSSSNVGIQGQSDSGYAIFGPSTSNHGVVGETGSSSAYGVWGIGSGSGFGVFCTGSFGATGAKSAIVPFPDGTHRKLYCMESPESWFEDFGTAALTNGAVTVQLDPNFAAVVHSEDYRVFLAPEGDSQGLYVSAKSPAGFVVREQQGGTSAIPFSYRVVARRKDVPAPRFEKVMLQEPPALPASLIKRLETSP